MKYLELVEKVRLENPNLLGGLNSKVAARVVKGVLELMRNELEATEDGVLRIDGFGRFKVKTIEKVVDGETVYVKRVQLTLQNKSS